MDLNIEIATSLCWAKVFIINGIDADVDDFGEKYDRGSDDDVEDYACGNMQFTRIQSTKEILEKYKITEIEYSEICYQLEVGLSFGSCGWCM